MEKIQKYVRSLDLGEIQAYRNLAIAPILGDGGNLEHIVLSDALKQGFEIREKGQGSVPTLFAVNRTGKNVLAISGEYIVGGRQNRTIIRSIYFDKKFEGEIPVRCVQHGRWNYGSPYASEPFVPESYPMPGPRIPRFPRPMPQLPIGEEAVFRHGGQAPMCAALYASDQHETWNAIDEVLSMENVRSASKDLNAVYEEKREDFEKYKKHFPVIDRQIGNLAVIGKNGQKIFVLDLFDRSGILGKHHENLLNSYALEAGLKSKSEVSTNRQEARGFLDSVDSCQFTEQDPVSAGTDYKISGANLQGSALLYGKDLVYMNLFTRKQDLGGNFASEPGIDGTLGNPGFSTGFFRCF
jgi:hypothetical protein